MAYAFDFTCSLWIVRFEELKPLSEQRLKLFELGLDQQLGKVRKLNQQFLKIKNVHFHARRLTVCTQIKPAAAVVISFKLFERDIIIFKCNAFVRQVVYVVLQPYDIALINFVKNGVFEPWHYELQRALLDKVAVNDFVKFAIQKVVRLEVFAFE